MKTKNQKRIEAVERALEGYETPYYYQNKLVKAPMLNELLKTVEKISSSEKNSLEERIMNLFLNFIN